MGMDVKDTCTVGGEYADAWDIIQGVRKGISPLQIIDVSSGPLYW